MVLFTVPGRLADFFKQEAEEPPAPEPQIQQKAQPEANFDSSRRSFLIGAGAVVAAPFVEQATRLAALTGDLYAEEAPANLSFQTLQQDAFFSRQYTLAKDTYTVEVEGQAYTAHRVERKDFELPREPTVTDIYRASNFIVTDGDQVVTDNLISSKAAYAANYSYAVQKTGLVENSRLIAEQQRMALTNVNLGEDAANYTKPLTKALSGALVKNPASLRAAAADMLNAVSKNAVKEMVRYLERQADGELSLEEMKKQISSGDLFVEAMMNVAEQGVQELEEVPRVLAARRGEPLSFEQARAAGVLSERGYTHTMAAFTALYEYHKNPKNFLAAQVLEPIIEGLTGAGEVKPGVLVELVIEKAMETYKVPLDAFFDELARQQLLQEELYGFEAYAAAHQDVLATLKKVQESKKQTQPLLPQKTPAQQWIDNFVKNPTSPENLPHLLGGYSLPPQLSLSFTFRPGVELYTVDRRLFYQGKKLFETTTEPLRGTPEYHRWDSQRQFIRRLEPYAERGSITRQELQGILGK